MLRISIPNLVPGMTIAAPIPHPVQPGSTLLKAGVALDEAILAKLRQTGVREVWIRYPGLTDVAGAASPFVAGASAEMTRLVDATFAASAHSASVRLDYNAYRNAVCGLLERLSLHPRTTVYLDQMVGQGCASVRHASAVCFISMLIGLRLEPWLIRNRSKIAAAKAREIANLGVGALLHDVGMLMLDQETRDRWSDAGDESDPEFRRHVQLGFDMVKDEIEPTASGIVLNHHQRYDGSGFPAVPCFGAEPRPLAAARIHAFARIVGLVDVFDRLRFGIDDRHLAEGGPVPTVRALAALQREPWRSRFDPVALMGLMSVVPPFAPGTLVTMSDGRVVAVVDWSPLDPCRPVVQDLELRPKRVRGWLVHEPGERIDLRIRRDLSIIRAEDADVSLDVYEPPSPRAFDLDALMRTWVDRTGDLETNPKDAADHRPGASDAA
ncbi:MAG: HD domain-containing protein [Phycisphaeraceae bacterium]|nr:HD domain-containing protein [Phycisphaeraceae bacterium]